jgi:nitrogen fixation protein NifU and related proteins
MSIEGMYQELILDHHKHPVGKGLREPFSVEVHHINTSCGDELTVRTKIDSDGLLADISWDGVGCAISMASMSMLAEMATGESVAAFEQRKLAFLEVMHGRGTVVANAALLNDAVAFQGVAQFAARVKCALLGWMAVADAIEQTSTVPQNNSQGGNNDN